MSRDVDPPAGRPGPSRRTVLFGTAGLALGASASACSSSGRHGSGGAGSASSAAALPRATVWRPNGSDVRPDVKLRAVQLVEALGTWRPGGRGPAKARERTAALGLPPGLAEQAGPLLAEADESVVQVVDAQYGGILDDTASVLVVCRRWTRTGDGRVTPGGTTVDVRLGRARPRWSVTALHPAAPGPAAASLPDPARRVLADSRIRLPPAAEADVRGGGVHDSVLRALLELAGTYRMDVSVLRSGHPIDVFGTDRPSDHPPGRAVDVWRIDDKAVVDGATPRGLIESFMRDAAAAGAYNVGGPVLPAGGAPGRPYFSDDTHHDHVHIGFDR
ncbi:hypothetical protein [Streptomyces sp. ISL-11]|uniref:hypothetical protein n=1 Tax=Streptomyces sp. ISL-11 TaxID=2819174 RepID=UPI001BE7B3D3|nr:hypothetical protein [Streptomyces sp. ISL-11]MBT2382175.1 hypothetical protein [Streptomyces sp. ISL-11]